MSTGNRTRRRELGLLPEPSKCVARKKDGTPCLRSPIKGAVVCRVHGGAAPQVRRKAAERIANAADIAVLQIVALMEDPNTPSAVKLAAARDLLDRADVIGKTRLEVDVPPWQEILTGIVATVPPGTPMREFHDPAVRQEETENGRALPVASERIDDAPAPLLAAREEGPYGPTDRDHPDPGAYGSCEPPPADAGPRGPHQPIGPSDHDPAGMEVVNGDDRRPPPWSQRR